jgi:hypothetical protein
MPDSAWRASHYRLVDVGICEHNQRTLAAQFERKPLQAFRSKLCHVLADKQHRSLGVIPFNHGEIFRARPACLTTRRSHLARACDFLSA